MSYTLFMLSKNVWKRHVALFGTCLNARGLIQSKSTQGDKHFTLVQLAD